MNSACDLKSGIYKNSLALAGCRANPEPLMVAFVLLLQHFI